MVDGVDVIGGVCDQEISNGKGEYPRQNKSDVVADEVEKCGAGGAGNRVVIFRVVHVVVFFLVYETMRLGDSETLDLETLDLEMLDSETLDLETLDLETLGLETLDLRTLDSDTLDLKTLDFQYLTFPKSPSLLVF